jgi:hypothetical protein
MDPSHAPLGFRVNDSVRASSIGGTNGGTFPDRGVRWFSAAAGF